MRKKLSPLERLHEAEADHVKEIRKQRDKDREVLGSRIKAAREASGYNQRELALLVGVTGGAVAAWDIGRAVPRADLLPTLARVLGTTVAYLIGDEGATATREAS